MAGIILYGLVGLVLLFVGSCVYSAYLHPLAKYPGPKTWAASRIPFVISLLSGQLPHRVRQLHDEYGPVVRLAPNELSFIDPAAWKDIYSNPKFIRPWVWRGKPPGAPGDNLISATEIDHARFRKILGPCFSEKAVRIQEPIINSYIELLIDKLKQKIQDAGSKSATIDIVEWLNYATFDIIGDLGWGSSFECLEKQALSGWIRVVLHFKAVVIGSSFKYFPPLDSFIDAITPKAALAPILGVVETAQEKVAERFAKKTDRPDMIGYITSQTSSDSGLGMTRGEIEMNSFAVIVAGSESTTTVLTGVMHRLLLRPDALRKLVVEIRSSFDADAAIDGASAAARLPYLNAVLNEGMRVAPSIPDGSRRDLPAGEGAVIAGLDVPAGTTVSVPQWSAYMSSSNFVDPAAFVPERWLEGARDSPYRRDRKEVFRPFGVGAHNCLGQPLAWHEMRVILARLLWNFDVELPDGSIPLKWESQKIYWTWEKVPMKVKLTLRP